MSTLFLMRHGQAHFGAADYDRLTDLGLRQAQASGAYFARVAARFDAVLIGPKRRHRDTAQGALALLDDAPAAEVVPALDEFAEATQVLETARNEAHLSPEALRALPRQEQLRHYGRQITAWMEGRTTLPNGLTAAHFRAGVAAWLHEVVARPGRGERLLAVSSAGVIAALVAEVLGLPGAGMAAVIRVVRNASLTEIEFSPGRISLLSFNAITHLPPELASSM